jgi:hypothetical protein
LDKETEKRFQLIENRLSKLEKIISEKSSESIFKSKTSDIIRLIVQRVEKIPTQHLVVISLKLNGKQTRDEIKKALADWGKVFGNWFKGGNFNNRLLKENVVKRLDKNENGDELFSLTQKGELLANKLLEKIQSKK